MRESVYIIISFVKLPAVGGAQGPPVGDILRRVWVLATHWSCSESLVTQS
jgi:hypothetical protein